MMIDLAFRWIPAVDAQEKLIEPVSVRPHEELEVLSVGDRPFSIELLTDSPPMKHQPTPGGGVRLLHEARPRHQFLEIGL